MSKRSYLKGKVERLDLNEQDKANRSAALTIMDTALEAPLTSALEPDKLRRFDPTHFWGVKINDGIMNWSLMI
jgi:hypothetical protein